jgi:hypothetical protein
MSSSIAERNLAALELPALVEVAFDNVRNSNNEDLDRVLGVTRIYEEIALRAMSDQRAIQTAFESPEHRGRLFQLVAYGAAALGDLLLQSMAAEEKHDLKQREKVDEVGSRLQSVTAELARLAAKE